MMSRASSAASLNAVALLARNSGEVVLRVDQSMVLREALREVRIIGSGVCRECCGLELVKPERLCLKVREFPHGTISDTKQLNGAKKSLTF